jgi:hypothetical protein
MKFIDLLAPTKTVVLLTEKAFHLPNFDEVDPKKMGFK